LFVYACVSACFNLVFVRSDDIRHLALFSFPFGWECKGRKVSVISKKNILFFFLQIFSFSTFTLPPKRDAKVGKFSANPNSNSHYFLS